MKYFSRIGHVYIAKWLKHETNRHNTVMDVGCCEYCTGHHITLHIFSSVCSTSQVREDLLV